MKVGLYVELVGQPAKAGLYDSEQPAKAGLYDSEQPAKADLYDTEQLLRQ